MTRKHNVQTPGAAPTIPDDTKSDTADQAGATGSDVSLPGAADQSDGAAGDSSTKAPGEPNAGDEMAQLRTRVNTLEFDFDKLREDFAQLAQFVQVHVSTQAAPQDSVLTKGAKHQHHSREHYAKMRAHEVDPAAITAPVLTLDGHVVPAPKDAK